MTSRPLRVFLCHSSADKPAVRELYQKLRAVPQGDDKPWILPWLDEEELFPGMDWNMEIEKAIEATDVILVCLSNNSITKEGYVQREIRIALDYADYKPEGTLFIIPVRLEECMPPKRLARWQYANYFEGQRERGFERLVVSLKRRVDSINLGVENIESSKISKPSSRSDGKIETLTSTLLNLQAKATVTQNKITLTNGMEFMRIPAGKYITGNKEQRDIEIPYDYWMSRFLVTNENYYQYVKSKSINHPVSNWMKKKDHPVAFVSWFDAVDYSNWLNLQCKNNLPDGKILRLPIRFEWEKAARGLDGRSYPWGNEFDKDKCNSWEGGGKGTTPVGAYSPIGDSPYGCSDMWGNIRVWAQEVAKVRIPEIPDNVDIRVTCGISYNNAGSHPISMNSFGEISEHKSRVGGFRLVIAPPLPK